MVWLRDQLNQAIRQDHRIHNNFLLDAPKSSYHHKINVEGISFTVYEGIEGGNVVETSIYDRKNETNITHLYVIQENQPLGAELERIIMLEFLKMPN